MIFIDNKYTRCYYRIVNRALVRTLSKGTYTEKHHIIPRSLSGPDTKDNLVVLTAREHYLCHLLLTKMTTGSARRSMWHAVWKVINQKRVYQKRHRVTARMYEVIRTANAKALSEANTGISKPHLKGRDISWADKISATLLSKNLKGIKKLTGQCEHCGIIAARHLISRYHGDKCKSLLPVVPKVRKKMKPRTPEHSLAIKEAKLRNKLLREKSINK